MSRSRGVVVSRCRGVVVSRRGAEVARCRGPRSTLANNNKEARTGRGSRAARAAAYCRELSLSDFALSNRSMIKRCGSRVSAGATRRLLPPPASSLLLPAHLIRRPVMQPSRTGLSTGARRVETKYTLSL